jgi:5'-nucleotidase
MGRRSVVRSLLLLALVALAPPAAAQQRPRILLTNDDGIAAPGLAAIYAELAKLGEVTVAAPAENQSGVGHGITYAEPILVAKIEPLVKVEGPQGPWYRIAARPATCVRLALTGLLEARPDLVVSGINRGDNAGLTLYVSGTVGAAREAAFDGLPSIAVSQVQAQPMDYRPGAALTARIAGLVLERGLPPGTFLNVNLPAAAIKGVRVVRHSLKAGTNAYDRRESPRRDLYFWNVWTPPSEAGEDTDVGAIAAGHAAVTPVRVDVNEPAALRAIEAWGLR